MSTPDLSANVAPIDAAEIASTAPSQTGERAMKYFALPNLRSQDITIVDPLTFKPDIPVHKTKEERRAWQSSPTTQHLFYSCVEGMVPTLRVTDLNPPRKIWAFVGDYDANINDESTVVTNAAPGLLASYVSRTFSGGRRLVFEFEAPVLIDQPQIAEAFVTSLAKELRVKDLLPGFDKASLNLTQYWEVGDDWHRVPGSTPLSRALLGLVFYRAAEKKSIRADGLEIPIEAVGEEVERRWPGRWPGSFVEGARGPLFWIDDGIDREGCQVGRYGMICYSDRAAKAFLSWSDILGARFVREFEAERIGAAMADTYFIEEKYWKKNAGIWRPHRKENFADDLRVSGINSRPSSRTDLANDVARVMSRLRSERVLDAAVPIVHDCREIVDLNCRQVLNTSRIRAMPPAGADDPQKSAWLHEFFEKIWDPAEPRQKDYFLAWFQRFYQNALQGEPKAGQAIVIAGDAGIGKTFLSWRIVGKALGGFSDGARFLKGETSFNKEIAEVPLLAIDDSEIADEIAARNKFTSTVKKFVADPQITYHPKGVDEITIPCKNRIIITCNQDAHSLGVLPRLDTSIKDKLMFFKFGNWRPSYSLPGGPEAYVASILPFWLRWLLDWKPPAYVLSPDPRFGIVPYKHPLLVRAVEEESPQTTLKEIIDIWFTESGRTEPEWMSAKALHNKLSWTDANRTILARELGGPRLGRTLSSLGKDYVLDKRTNRSTNAGEYLVTSPAICKK